MTDATSFAKCTIQEKDFFQRLVFEDFIWILVGISDICFQIAKEKKLHVRIFRIEEVG